MLAPVLLDEDAPKPSPELAAVLNPRQRYIPEAVARAHRRKLHCRRTTHGKPSCTWCGGPVRPPKQTYCSEACVREWMLRRSGSALRAAVFDRDAGVCAGCGLDTEALRRSIEALDWDRMFRAWLAGQETTKDAAARWNAEVPRLTKERERELNAIDPFWLRYVTQPMKTLRSLWEADHVRGVVDGGGQCGVGNLQTLCLRCHVEKSSTRRRRK